MTLALVRPCGKVHATYRQDTTIFPSANSRYAVIAGIILLAPAPLFAGNYVLNLLIQIGYVSIAALGPYALTRQSGPHCRARPLPFGRDDGRQSHRLPQDVVRHLLVLRSRRRRARSKQRMADPHARHQPQDDFAELGRAVHSEMGRLPKEVREDLEATKLYDPFFGTASSAAHIAQVEVDPEAYLVTVRRYVVAEDCGRVINPLIVDGQVHGGVAQGIGAALLEEVIHDKHGQALTASLVDYLVPSAAEIPPIEVIHLEAEPPSTLGGFRGMGEGGTIGAPAAIANAISDALRPLRIEINTLPAFPERLFRLVSAARQARAG